MSNSELRDLGLLVRKLVLFSLPLAAYLAVVIICDPFNFVGGPKIISDEVKKRSARPLNPCLWKLLDFRRAPAANIMLGDSRMDEVPAEQAGGLDHEPYVNLSYGGASLNECIRTFWFADRRTKLRKVYFGMSFEMFNDYAISDRTDAFLNLEHNPAFYFINRTVFQAMAYSVYSAALNKDLRIGAPNMTKEQFWDYEINGPETARIMKNHLYPVRYLSQLAEIGQHCKEAGIQLTFVIFPTHVDYQNRISALQMDDQKQRMIQDLAAIGTVLDFDYSNDLTREADNYRDPVHLKDIATGRLIDEIWGGGQPAHARVYPGN